MFFLLSLDAAVSLVVPETAPVVIEQQVEHNNIQPLILTEHHIGEDIQQALLQTIPQPKITPMVFPKIGATSWLIGDNASGIVLAEQQADVAQPIASLAKLMTVVVALDHYSPEEFVRVSRAAAGIEGSQVGLRTGEEVTVRDLVYAALIKSGNDAAQALAEHAPGGKKIFVQWMNEKAIALGLSNTSFQNAVGFDHKRQYSSARDLFMLSRYIKTNYMLINDAVQLRTYTFHTKKGRNINLETTNKLFDTFLNVKGMKTGTSEGAGESFIGVVGGEEGQEVVMVLLHSPDRFGEAKIGLWWALVMWGW